MQIKEQQSRDSVRIVWNVMASNRTLQARAAVPQALHFTPLSQRQDIIIDHVPPKCNKCDAYMNPYNRINLNKTQYTCCICKSANIIPQNYLMQNAPMPPEMTLNYSSFVITQNTHTHLKRLGYLFVVDTCVSQRQLDAIKQAILDLVASLEDNYNVGLITYNKYVSLYDLRLAPVRIHYFSPQEQYKTIDFIKMLEIPMGDNRNYTNKFVCPLELCRETFENKVKALSRIKNVSYKHQREARATGQALNLALSINEIAPEASKIIFFCGGPCTIGGGKLIEQDYKVEMRSIKQQTPKLSKKAKEYYSKLSIKARSKQTCIDSFIFSVEETGFAEMSELLTTTGGLFVQHQEFNSVIFKQSFKKAYQGLDDFPPVEVAAYSSISIKCSEQILISQNSIQLQQNKQSSSLFILGGLNESRIITLIYELSELNVQSQAYYIQIKTIYRYPQNLSMRFQRVTTIRRLFSNFIGDLVSGFDEGAALALLSKLSINKSLEMSSDQVRQWLDNILCKWASTCGEYRSGEPLSFKLHEKIRSFPQFVYNIRKNPIVRRSGLSLDEFAYICAIVKNQSVENIILIIQPALLQYTSEHNSMNPIPLDEKYMKKDSVLVLDSFFNVVEWRGDRIEKALEENEHNHVENSSLKNLLENVENDVKTLKSDRFPVPHYYLTHTGHSKERFIKSRLSSREHEQVQSNLSDEVDVSVFTQKLIELVVNKKI